MAICTLKIKNEIVELSRPLVMGIINTTPDSFYSGSRNITNEQTYTAIDQAIEQQADIIDIGGVSTRSGADILDLDEEWRRVEPALKYAFKQYPKAALSVDTFRSEIAKRAREYYGIDIVNDVSGGMLDSNMIETVGKLGIGYVGMHMIGTPSDMQQHVSYDNLLLDISRYLGDMIQRCKLAGIADIIVDPGIGFSKTLDQNYEIINKLDIIKSLGYPVLVGVSRKSLIYKYLNITPEDSLIGTAVMNALLLVKGADILRVHDVKQAVETVKLFQKTLNS